MVIWLVSLAVATVGVSYYVKKTKRYHAITGMYCVYVALSQVLASKQVLSPIGTVLGLNALFGVMLVTAGGAFDYPFTYQLTDTMNEFFGEGKTHEMIIIAFVSQIVMTLFIFMSVHLQPAPWWMPNQPYWVRFFGLAVRITAASWIAFLVSENLDAWLFDRIKSYFGKSNAWNILARSAGSDAVSLTIDSIIFTTLAFYGVWSLNALISTILGLIVIKWLFGLIDTPFFYLSRYIVYGSLSETPEWGKNN